MQEVLFVCYVRIFKEKEKEKTIPSKRNENETSSCYITFFFFGTIMKAREQ